MVCCSYIEIQILHSSIFDPSVTLHMKSGVYAHLDSGTNPREK